MQQIEVCQSIFCKKIFQKSLSKARTQAARFFDGFSDRAKACRRVADGALSTARARAHTLTYVTDARVGQKGRKMRPYPRFGACGSLLRWRAHQKGGQDHDPARLFSEVGEKCYSRPI